MIGSSSVADLQALFVRAQDLHTLAGTGQETVTQIKAHVASLEGIAPEDQVVLLAGTPLEDEATLGQYGVEVLTTPEVAGRRLGGKVHGSLACAGKVRGQTPKVAKQEKKEKRKGRDKWRMQYNRHFVNIVLTLGKKKSPNANS
ncbi:ubiquitin-like protein FUBI [Rhinolophus ferrumequinum]|uniref:ubiquitin-like protein FUBI n=1 Tax=Rhinolophus ferrumequinum TaxID=59479 RepID=UPI00140F5EB6|nr:ubiquitin-like protein FUBI [Rhinolophus ferrumequinum]